MLGIYCRISVDRKNQVSIEVQESAGIKFAKEQGFEYEVYIDKGISGRGDISERPSYSRLLADLASGKINKVYLYERSRNDRNIMTWLTMAEFLRENNIPLYLNGKHKDLRENDTFYPLVYASVEQQKYADEISEKIKDALLMNAKKGRAFSVNPYGYKTRLEETIEENKTRKYLEIDENEMVIVHEIFKMSLQGIGTDTIALKLREMGVPTRRGGIWSGKQVQDIIKNPIHKGYRRWGTKDQQEEEFYVQELASMSVEYWNKVNANLHNNRNSGEKQMKFNYLLKGLCTCAVCGRNYYGRTRKAEEGKKPNDHYYMCSSKRKGQVSCGNRSIGIDKLESLVWDVVKSGVLKSELINYFESANKNDVREEIKKDIETIQRQLADFESKIKRLLDLFVDGILERSRYLDKEAQLKSEKDLMLSKLSRLEEQLSKSDLRLAEVTADLDESKLMEMLSFNEKRQLLFKYIDRVKILSIEGNAHYVGINIIHGAIPLVYYVSMKGEVKPLTVGFIRENKHILEELGNNKEFKPTLSVIGESNG